MGKRKKKEKPAVLFGLFQFMKFMKRIGEGEITIEDNEVIERIPGAGVAARDTGGLHAEVNDEWSGQNGTWFTGCLPRS